MAHFAQLNKANTVIQVIVIGNKDCSDSQGIEREEIGIQFCKSLFGQETIWLQTSINNRIRKNYAGIGYTYDAVLDAFIAPKPFPSWLLNTDTCRWEAPVPKPPDTKTTIYVWDEAKLQWVAVDLPVEDKN